MLDGTSEGRVAVTVAGEPVTREVTLAGFVAYLEREGWVEVTAATAGNRVFRGRGDGSGSAAQRVVVNESRFRADFGPFVREWVEHVASVLHRTPAEVLEGIAALSGGAGEHGAPAGEPVSYARQRGRMLRGGQTVVWQPIEQAMAYSMPGVARLLFPEPTLRLARQRMIFWTPASIQVGTAEEGMLPGRYASLRAARWALGALDGMLAAQHQRVADLPREEQTEAHRRAIRSFSAAEHCVRHDGCQVDGLWVVWPDGERWLRRTTLRDVLEPALRWADGMRMPVPEAAVPGLHGVGRDLAVVVRNARMTGDAGEVVWVGDADVELPWKGASWEASSDRWEGRVLFEADTGTQMLWAGGMPVLRLLPDEVARVERGESIAEMVYERWKTPAGWTAQTVAEASLASMEERARRAMYWTPAGDGSEDTDV